MCISRARELAGKLYISRNGNQARQREGEMAQLGFGHLEVPAFDIKSGLVSHLVEQLTTNYSHEALRDHSILLCNGRDISKRNPLMMHP